MTKVTSGDGKDIRGSVMSVRNNHDRLKYASVASLYEKFDQS